LADSGRFNQGIAGFFDHILLQNYSLFREDIHTFHLHPHLPHFEMLGDSADKLDVLVEQRIDLEAPPHPFVKQGRTTFDALLQSKPNVFGGRVLICDATIWTSTNGGLGSLRQFWANVTRLA
jgi:hypothetical protein